MIPDYQTLMLPLLKHVADGRIYAIRDVAQSLARDIGLAQAELEELLPSGRQTVFANRVHWAKTYLTQAKLLETTARGQFRITERGLVVLSERHQKVGVTLLDQFPEFREFKLRSRQSQTRGSLAEETDVPSHLGQATELATPDEVLRSTIAQIESALAAELLTRILAAPPAFFEELIVTLLLRMGYGGSREDAGRAVGRSGDGGIDGVIDQDPLGLDRVYLQAKRFKLDTPVSEPDIRAFSGSLGGAKASKGVFVTTSSFTRPAREFADRHPFKLVLIDGTQLTQLMIRYSVGVRNLESFWIRKVDEDFFGND